ncbi:MAG: RNA pyrophosphohydrolase [Gammaproteobacteria bacterium]
MSIIDSAVMHGIDKDGFRANVGMVICSPDGRLFWGRRTGQSGWQFPQGGVNPKEKPIDAMYRELREEVGLEPNQVKVLGHTQNWLRYKLPERYRRRNTEVKCIGQKQIWFLLQLDVAESAFRFDLFDHPEFDQWRWVEFWYPVNHVIYFKRNVYKRALNELEEFLSADSNDSGRAAQTS